MGPAKGLQLSRRGALLAAAGLGASALLAGCGGMGRIPWPGGQLPDAVVPAPEPGSTAWPTPIIAFAGRLHERLAGVDRNLLWSPWSLAMTLAMARDGAAGQTASEMTDVLGAHSDFDARLADGWRRMAHAQGTPLRAANAAWAQSGLEWKQLFRDHLADLSADLKVADFAAGAAGPTDEINRWVADRTAGKVPDLLAPGALTAETRLVLVNALHFKAAWQREFAELGERPFAAPSGSVSAPFLEARGLVGIRYRGWTSAIIPCEGSEFALAVALPDDPSTPLAKVPTIALSLPTAHPEPVGQVAADLTMPAWKLSFAVTLNDQLRTLGMPTAFDPGLADFSAMTAGERLFLGLVVQKATIDVQAKGIEAAAASAVVVVAGSAPASDPVPLVLDRPFAYALVHTETRTPLLVGQVVDPTKSS